MNEPRPHEAVTPIQRLVRPFQEFADLEASGGLLLIGCTVAALIWANSPFAGNYFHFWHTDLTFGHIGGLLAKPLHFWINDGLMALFFLLVGLEIKREILVGELASFQKAVLPIAAALGGMALLGSRVPTSLKVFLAALAIADDIGAVLVIASFYTERISWISLGVGGVFFVALL